MFVCTYRGFLTRMVYLYYISCLRYTILVGNPQYTGLTSSFHIFLITICLYNFAWLWLTLIFIQHQRVMKYNTCIVHYVKEITAKILCSSMTNMDHCRICRFCFISLSVHFSVKMYLVNNCFVKNLLIEWHLTFVTFVLCLKLGGDIQQEQEEQRKFS